MIMSKIMCNIKATIADIAITNDALKKFNTGGIDDHDN